MPMDRLSKAQERLNSYYEAELAILSGQEYRIGTRNLRRADLAEVRQAIHDLENYCEEMRSQMDGKGARKAFRVIPIDL